MSRIHRCHQSLAAFSSALLSALFLATAQAGAATFTWDGGRSHGQSSASDAWNAASNWVSAVPAAGATTDVVFGLSDPQVTSNQNLGSPFALRSLAFATDSNVHALTGNALSFGTGGSIQQNSATALTLATPLVLTANTTVSGSGSGMLALNGAISGAGQLRVNSSAVGSPPMQVALNAANTHSGGLRLGNDGPVRAVELTLGHNQAAGTGPITFINGNTLVGGGASFISLTNAVNFSPQANGLLIFFRFAGQNFDLRGAVDLGSTCELRIDTDVGITGSLAGFGPLLKTGSRTLHLQPQSSTFIGDIYVSAGTLTPNSTILANRTVQVDSPGLLAPLPVTTTTVGMLQGSGTLDLTGGRVQVGQHSNALSATFTGFIGNTVTLFFPTIAKVGANTTQILTRGSSRSFQVEAQAGSLEFAGGEWFLRNISVGGTAGPGTFVLRGAGTDVTSELGASIAGGAGTRLKVTDGARLNAGPTLQVGTSATNPRGMLEISAAASVSVAALRLGAGPEGEMLLASGGQLTTTEASLGSGTNTSGIATVEGTGTSWQTGNLALGGQNASLAGGQGKLHLRDAATLSVTGTTTFFGDHGNIIVEGGSFGTGGLVGGEDAQIALSDPSSGFALTVGSGDVSSSFGGRIDDSGPPGGGLRKIGQGTLTLTGRLTYTGTTRVERGMLQALTDHLDAQRLEIWNGGRFVLGGAWGDSGSSVTMIESGGELTGRGRLVGQVTNAGLIDIAGIQEVTIEGEMLNTGRIRVRQGGRLRIQGALNNPGGIDVMTAGSVALPPGSPPGLILDRHSLRPRVSFSGGQAQVEIQALGGHSYQLQRCTDLASGAFVDVGSPVALSADQVFTFAPETAETKAFYRVKVD